VTATHFLPLGRAWDLVDRCASSIRAALSSAAAADAVEPAGEIRRSGAFVPSLIIVIRADDPNAALGAIASIEGVTNVRRVDDHVLVDYARTPIELHAASPFNFGSVLFKATGSDAHVQAIVQRGLADTPFPTEEALYSSVGLPLIPPEIRHGDEEIEVAARGALPPLVSVADMRGDLHMHTTYSDGRDALATMVEGCHAIGYEYIAITDHSWHSSAARTLAVDEIARQRDEIDGLRERFSGMTILHGVEVDIMPDGQLDFDDDILETFDIVLASLHERAGQNEAQLTQRSLAALHHPLVNVLCHPANRLVGSSMGYALDFDALYDAARETGTALEVDGAPMHLDLDGERARAARAVGVTMTIDSDCHRVDALGRQMRFGVGTARRGWVAPQHVLNTRPLAEVRAFIAAKRRGLARP
jgi:DNA polymerase (family X)